VAGIKIRPLFFIVDIYDDVKKFRKHPMRESNIFEQDEVGPR